MTRATSRGLATCALALILLVVFAPAAAAQVIQRPPRSTSGVFGGPEVVAESEMGQELSGMLDILGGYDDNLQPRGQAVSPLPFEAQRSGVTGTMTAGLKYRYGGLTRGIETTGRTFVNTFQNLGVSPLVGGAGNVRAFSRFLTRTSVVASVDADYQPTFMFGTFGPAEVGGPLVPSDPTGGVTELRSMNGSASAAVTRDWTRRQRSTVAFAFAHARLYNATSTRMTNYNTTTSHAWDFARNFGVQGTYSYSDQSAHDAAIGVRPTETQNAMFRLEWRRPVSRTRRLLFSGGAGASHVRTTGLREDSQVEYSQVEYVAPSGMLSVRMDLARTWSVSADVRRYTTMLHGIVAQSFLTTGASLWLGGNLTPRAQTAIVATLADGAPHEGQTGSYRSFGGTAQLQYALSNCCSALVSYSYYEHRLRDVASVPEGYPQRFERNALRVGLSIWLPLYGTFLRGARP